MPRKAVLSVKALRIDFRKFSNRRPRGIAILFALSILTGYVACSIPADEEVSVLPLLTVLSEQTNDETAGIILRRTAQSLTEGETASYTIVLGAEPKSDVIVDITADIQTSVDVSQITFTAANYSVPQVVTVTASDDEGGEGTHTGTITHTLTSSDTFYNGLTNDDFTAIITDNDVTCKRVFRSAASRTGGAIGGIAAADAICNSDINRPTTASLPTYKAMLVDGTNRRACTSANCTGASTDEHIDWVLQPSTTYSRSDCTTTIFTTNANGVFPFGTASSNVDGSGADYWTGLVNNWTTNGTDCTDWSATTGNSRYGEGNQTNNRLISRGNLNCTSTANLLCVEQPIE